MPAIVGTAPGKIILFGEHAVVYGRPAIAAPVTPVRARASIQAAPTAPHGQVQIIARDIGLVSTLDCLPADHPLYLAIYETAHKVGVKALPALRLELTSTIPIASGLGSSAAIAAAIARALSAFLGRPLGDADISAIALRVDQRLHGAPSGIDNTVIAYSQPVFYSPGQPFERLQVGSAFTVVIGDTGVRTLTGAVVQDVRRRWLEAQEEYESLFDQIGEISRKARVAIEKGPIDSIGALMSQNQRLLQALDVSSPELDRLAAAALAAGAAGAKLCGGGRGGNMIALAEADSAARIAAALHEAGAVNTIITTISP